MTAVAGVSLTGRRFAGRVLSGVRTAPYLRKWLILGTVIGVVAGLGAVVFYDGLRLATHVLLGDVGGYTPAQTAGEGGFRAASGFSRPWAIPLVVGGGGLVAGVLVFEFAPEAEGHGTDAAIKAVHTNPKGVRPRVIIVKLVASAITIGSGGSGGREGPTAQISSGFGSVLARTLNLTPADSRICVSAGIASGIGAIFRAPFGGALLGVELLYVNDVEIEALIPSFVATIVAYAIFCAITGSFSPIFGDHSGATISHAWELALFIAVGVACGAVGKLYTISFYWLTDRFAALAVPRVLKPALAGLAVGVLGLAVPGVLGTGYGEVQVELDLHRLLTMPLWVVLVLPFAKLAATGLSIGSGGSGGIFGPGMVIGGATGAALWRLGHLAGIVGSHDQVAFVIVGMAACFGAVAHAPISVLLMVAEMTGSLALLPPAMVAIAFATLVVGGTTIYRNQLRSRADSGAHRLDLGLPPPSSELVRDLMSIPRLVITAATAPAEALRQLQDAGLPGAPVVNTDGAFAGSVQTSALTATTDAGHATVGRLADAEAMTLPPDAGLDAAIEALPASKGGWVPVLADDMTVLGIVSGAELVRGWQRMTRRSVDRLANAAGATTVVEGAVGTGSSWAGMPISDLGLPRGSAIISTVRGGRVVASDASQRLATGDMVTVLTRPADADAVRGALGASDGP